MILAYINCFHLWRRARAAQYINQRVVVTREARNQIKFNWKAAGAERRKQAV